MMGETLPQGWTVATLGDVVGPVPGKIKPDPTSNLPFIGMDHIASEALRPFDAGEFKAMKSAAAHFNKGDVLFGRLRPYLKKVFEADREGAASAEFIVFPASDMLDSRFLMYRLHSQDFIDFAKKESSGDRPRVDRDDLLPFELLLPPLTEQTRIASKIDELFSRIDEGEAALKRVEALVGRYRQSVLKAAVTGRLTAAWRAANPPAEDGETRLARLLEARRHAWEQAERARLEAAGKPPKDDRWKAKYKSPTPPDTTDLPDLPEGWVWVNLEQLSVRAAHNGLSIKGSNSPPGTATLKLSALNSDNIDFKEHRYIRIDGETENRLLLKAGDFLVSRANGSKKYCGIGRLVQITPMKVMFPDTIIRYQLIQNESLARWVELIWGSGFVREKIEDRAKTSAGIYKVSQSDLAAVAIPLPPDPEISVLVDAISRRMAEASAFARSFRELPKSSAALRQSILKAAFAGKLVPQDPADEPADALLARIAAAREGEGVATKRQTKRGRK